VKLVYTVKEIEYLNNYFKMNSEILSEDEFIDGISKLLDKSPAMCQGIISSYRRGKYLQPGYLTEINICATLAKMMNLTYDNDSPVNVRHQYSNGNIFLKEYGGCGLSDVQLITADGLITTIEIKEPLALVGDYDLGITEEGKLFPKIAENRIFPEEAQKILDDFNASDSLFNYLGHNIPLSNVEYLKSILNSYLTNKNIDYIATYSKTTNELIYFSAKEIYNHINFNRSEIRTAGKNSVKVYTPKAFYKALIDIGCTIDSNNIVIIPKSKISFRYARGSNGRISGIKINSIFYFKINDILKEDTEFYYVKLDKGMQLKQSMTVHFNLK